jgi:hypothetical protein
MAAIIRHFRAAGQAACLSGISEKTAHSAQLPHLRPSFAENKFNRHEKNSGSGHISARIRGQSQGKAKFLIAKQLPKKGL